jgi:hypothetical protein
MALGLVLMIVGTVLSVFALSTLHRVDSAEFKIDNQKVALEKGCILLNNAIIQSSQVTPRPQSASAVLVESILKRMTPEERQRYKDALKNAKKPIIKLANCKQLAQHPDSIRATPTEQKQQGRNQ